MSAVVRVDLSVMPGVPDVEVTGPSLTVRDALIQLARAVPALGARLFNCDGQLRSVFRTTRAGQEAGLGEPLRDGDILVVAIR